MSCVGCQVSQEIRLICAIGLISLIGWVSGAIAVDYPQWRGPDGSGATPDSGVELVEDMTQAKVVWKSEEIPNVYNFQMKSQDAEGGYTSPSLADGRIYMQWYAPAGEAVSEIRKKVYPSYPPETWKVYADDVFICIDAKTGKTLWKRTFEEKGAYMWGLCGLMHTQPAVHNGKVYGVGSLARVYCMDAKTGAVVWESSLGAAHEWAVARVKEFLAAQADPSFDVDGGKKNPWNRNGRAQNVLGLGFDGSLFSVLMPQLAIGAAGGGVLVCNDGCRKNTSGGGLDGLVALDLETGAQRWYLPDVVTHRQSPTVWYSEGHPYVLTTGDSKEGLACRDALTGELKWTLPGVSCTMDAGPVVSGPYIVVRGAPLPSDQADKKWKTNLGCYKADAAGATKLWTADPSKFFLTGDQKGWMQPVIYRDHVYCATQFGHKHAGYGCMDLLTGEVKRVVDGGDGVGGYCAILASDGRLVAESDVLDAEPDNFRLLMKTGSFKPGHDDWAKSNGDALSVLNNGVITRPDGSTVKTDWPNDRMFNSHLFANGFYYWRGPHHLYCIDLRKPEYRK